VALAQAAIEQLGLERLHVVPTGDAWHKARALSPAADRLALTEAACAGLPGLRASDLEIERGGPSYTVDTLAELRAGDPSAELFVILGRDAAHGVPTWERAHELGDLATLVVVDRPGASEAALPPGYRWCHITCPRLDVSSSDLRARVREGRPIDVLVPPAVVSSIRERRLYREADHG